MNFFDAQDQARRSTRRFVILYILATLGIALSVSLVIGFGGSFISLAMSKWMAKRSTGAQVITQPRNAAESWLLATVENQARQAGIEDRRLASSIPPRASQTT